MPFPLAHPAAVLPLRRYCPWKLSLPALVIGSLSPDFAYGFGPLHLDWLSHRFLAGSFGFCLPVGFLVLVAFYLVRRPLLGVLPAQYRQVFWPFCQQPIGPAPAIVISLLIGAWTHILLDSMTHEDGWLVEHLPVLQGFVPWAGKHGLRVYDVLYYACTFAGVTWVALFYLRWLEKAPGAPAASVPAAKWGWALMLATAALFIAAACRGPHQSLGLIPAGLLTVLLVVAFISVTTRPMASTAN
jgi:hypothetical protein